MQIPVPAWTERLATGKRRNALSALFRGLSGGAPVGKGILGRELLVSALPAIALGLLLLVVHQSATEPVAADESGLVAMGAEESGESASAESFDGVREPEGEGVQEPVGEGAQEPLGEAEEPQSAEAPAAETPPQATAQAPAAPTPEAGSSAPASVQSMAPTSPNGAGPVNRLPTPTWYWLFAGLGLAGLAAHYVTFSVERLQVFKMLLGSFFPLATLILAVLGSIVFGWATPTEAAAMGATGGLLLAAAYRKLTFGVVKESAFLCGKTTAMVCWLFVGSSIFSAAFALLGGQEIIERWVLSLQMSPIQFMLLAQFIIFILGWPLEWTEIIVIFMPIFLPLLGHFNIDPLFFGLLVALNLQTAFLSPPVAMAAFYLKGVSPKHVTLNQIFGGMIPFMVLQVVALALLYIFPGIGLWLPSVIYK
jgi:hypothetical protein